MLLLVAQRRGARRARPGAVSRGREAHFWALLAAFGVFVVGAVLAILQGIHELIRPVEATSFFVAYIVLAVAFTLEATSFAQASRQLRAEAAGFERGLVEHVRLTSDPTTRAVFGSVVPDALASIAIGLVLAAVARVDVVLVGQAPPATGEAGG